MWNSEFLNYELQFWILLSLTIPGSFYELKKVSQNVFYSEFPSEKQFFNYGRIDFSQQYIVKFRIFQFLSFIFESGENLGSTEGFWSMHSDAQSGFRGGLESNFWGWNLKIWLKTT